MSSPAASYWSFTDSSNSNRSNDNDSFTAPESVYNINETSNSNSSTTLVELVMEHLDWGRVFRKKNGKVIGAVDLMSDNLAVVFGLLCAIGLPLNFELVFRILHNANVRSKSRFIIQLFISGSSCFTLFVNLMRIVHFYWPNDPLCRSIVAVINVSYVTFLFNILLSLIDVFVAIVFPLWHSLRCAVPIIHAINYRITVLVLFVSCVTLHIVDFVLVWRKLPRSSSAVHGPNNEAISRMELQSIKRFLVGLIPLFCLSLPLLISNSTFQILCHKLSPTKDVCSEFTWLIPFSLILISVHAIVTPCVSLWLISGLPEIQPGFTRVLVLPPGTTTLSK